MKDCPLNELDFVGKTIANVKIKPNEYGACRDITIEFSDGWWFRIDATNEQGFTEGYLRGLIWSPEIKLFTAKV